jgi:hypothetical protein
VVLTCRFVGGHQLRDLMIQNCERRDRELEGKNAGTDTDRCRVNVV